MLTIQIFIYLVDKNLMLYDAQRVQPPDQILFHFHICIHANSDNHD